ncbi:MAG: hypothetical protein V4733_03805 [Verrucomicrobiota bacterium]
MKELIDIGFSPIAAMLIAALVVLAGVIRKIYTTAETRREEMEKRILEDREKWHGETRSQLNEAMQRIAAGEARHDECEKDRDKLHGEVGSLRDRVTRFERCSKGAECPMRLP